MATRPGPIPAGTPFRTLQAGRSGTVKGVLGEGGQGAVYGVECEGSLLALKWYHDHIEEADRSLRPRLVRAMRQGAPNDQFLWPLDLVEISGRRSFGYLMGLREPRFRCMSDLLARPPRRIEPALGIRLALCRHVAENFLQLHAAGFCYQDVNFGNIFFDPADGEVRICDNDNVDVDGVPAAVYGTRKFMAPEIVRREVMPSTRTDLFSLGVLFFYVLCGWHPLDGRRETEARILDAETERRLYGEAPLFLFDPRDGANGPVPGFHDGVSVRWAIVGPHLQALFRRTFGRGLIDRDARVHEPEWCRTLQHATLAVTACGRCGAEFVFEPAGSVCPVCRAASPAPAHLILDRRPLVLVPGLTLPAAALGLAAAGGQGGARLEAHPDRPGVFGLRNLGQTAWQADLPGGRSVAVPPGRTVLAEDGLEIRFGERRARLRWPQRADGGLP